jgi:hypothetical protein
MAVLPYNDYVWLNLFQWLAVALLFGLLTRGGVAGRASGSPGL